MLKIAHLSDIHLGYRGSKRTDPVDHVNLREKDGYQAFSAVVGDVIREGVDVCVIAGDLFHTPHPDVRTVLVAQKQLRRLAKAGVSVYCLAGNHDTSDIRSEISSSRLVHDPDRRIFSHVEPYVKYEVSDGVFVHLISHHMYMDQKDTMSLVKPVDGAVNILSTHGSVIDPVLKMKLHTEQSPREIVIPDFFYKDMSWDYTMLGHIHERGWVASSDGKTDTSGLKIFYNGSLIRRGFADKQCKLGRGWTLWVLNDDGSFSCDVREVPQRPQFDLKPIDASSLSAQEITDLVVSGLKKTQGDSGTVFAPETAPIVRQKIVNISLAKKSALDLKAIDVNAAHTLQWSMPMTFESMSRSKTSSSGSDRSLFDDFSSDSQSLSNDMLKLYDDWVNDSGVLDDVDDRETVEQRARDFVRLGQEEVFEND